jgi:hypothetical protein
MHIVGSARVRATVRAAWRGAGLGLVAVVAVPAASALAQTVQVGAATVTVPSSGQIVVDGQTVDVQPSVKRVVVAAPPAGSTPFQVDGQTEYQLPAGATGESFTYSSANSYGNSVTVPTTAVYGSTSTTTAPAASGPTCEITAYPPSANGGQATVKGTSDLNCTGSGAASVQVRVQSTLYWESASGGGWKWQGYAKSPWGYEYEVVTFTHACTRGTTNFWHTRADGLTIYQGLEVSYLNNSRGPLVHCT